MRRSEVVLTLIVTSKKHPEIGEKYPLHVDPLELQYVLLVLDESFVAALEVLCLWHVEQRAGS